MAAPVTKMTLHGAKELEKALLDLPKRIAKTAVRRGIVKLLQQVADDAQARVPVRSGRLKEKIAVRPQLSRRQKRGRAKDKGLIEAFVGATPARHAHLVEFGTGPRMQRNGKSTGAMPAQPFLRPAWDGAKGKLVDELGQVLWDEIEKAAPSRGLDLQPEDLPIPAAKAALVKASVE